MIIHNCDNLNGWAFWPTGTVGIIDTIDFVEGAGSIRVGVDPVTPPLTTEQLNAVLSVQQDWSGEGALRIRLKTSGGPAAVLYIYAPDSANAFSVNLPPYLTQLDTWLDIEIPFSALTVYTGAPSLNMIRSLRYRYWWGANLASYFALDSIETVAAPPPPSEGSLEVHAYSNGLEVSCSVTIVETGTTFQSPYTVPLLAGTYTVQATYGGNSLTQEVTVFENETAVVTFTFLIEPSLYNLTVNSNIQGVPFVLKDEGENSVSYVTPFSSLLEEGMYEVEMPSNVLVGTDTWNFVQWEDGSTNPVRTIALNADVPISATYQLQLVTAIEVHTFLDSVEVVADGLIKEIGFTFQTPVTVDVMPGAYTVQLKYAGVVKEYAVDVSEGQTIRVDGQMTPPTLRLSKLAPLIPLGVGLGLIYIARGA